MFQIALHNVFQQEIWTFWQTWRKVAFYNGSCGIPPSTGSNELYLANAIFMREMGKRPEENLLPQKSYYRYLGRMAEYPDSYKMSEKGVFLRESVLDIPQVENLFVTPRMFNYYMSRKSSEEWEQEQSKDQNHTPLINIQSIENGVNTDPIEKLLLFENGKADYRKLR